MKITNFILGSVPCVLLALTSQAQTVNTLDWQFSTAGNPVDPTAETSNQPSGGDASATFIDGVNSYFFGAGPEGLYGTRTGLWDSLNGHLSLDISDRTAVVPISYTLTVTHFVDSSGAFFPGSFEFSIPNEIFVGRTVVEAQSGDMVGQWVADTFQWNNLNIYPSTVNLTIGPGPGNGDLFFDSVKLIVSGGDLVLVPEPATASMAALGLLAFGLRSWLRRKA